MVVIWKGGPGHKAPYRTTHIRVPEPIKVAVQEMCDDFKRGALIDQPASEIRGDTVTPVKTTQEIETAIALLTESLTLPANKGGAIKVKIKQALAILEDA